MRGETIVLGIILLEKSLSRAGDIVVGKRNPNCNKATDCRWGEGEKFHLACTSSAWGWGKQVLERLYLCLTYTMNLVTTISPASLISILTAYERGRSQGRAHSTLYIHRRVTLHHRRVKSLLTYTWIIFAMLVEVICTLCFSRLQPTFITTWIKSSNDSNS